MPSHEIGVEWDAASIFEHVLRRLRPGAPPQIYVEFRPYASMNHTIRLRQGRILVRLSDLLEHAPPAVVEALAVILLSKLFGLRVPGPYRERYRRYVNGSAVRSRIELARRVRGSKRAGSPAGNAYHLEELFDRLNRKYFSAELPRPKLAWSRADSRTALGHYDPAHNTIVLSRLLDRPEAPPVLVEFILYHEMLHLKHPVEPCDGRRRVHSAAFSREEKKFALNAEARRALKSLTSLKL